MSRFDDVTQQLGVAVDAQLRHLALTHRSYSYENGGIPTNERLEFLGDAVLGVAVTGHLYSAFPEYPEGRLAKLRSAVVNSHALAEVARSLDIGRDILLGRGEISTGGHDKTSILADTMEALIGAVFLTGGIGASETLVHHLFDHLVDEADAKGAGLDWKTSLQERCSELGLAPPEYLITIEGPDHQRHFSAVAVIDGNPSGEGSGPSKKRAEQQAAARAFQSLAVNPDPLTDA